MPLPPACTARTALLLLSILVQTSLKKPHCLALFPQVWASLGFWPFVQDFQTFRAVVLTDCPRSGSPTHCTFMHVYVHAYIHTNYTFTTQLVHVYEGVTSGRYYTWSPRRSSGQEWRILWEPEGSHKAPTDFRRVLNKHLACWYGEIWLCTTQY